MTQPAPTVAPVVENEEEPLQPPIMDRMLSNPFYPEAVPGAQPQPLLWKRGEQNPMNKNAQIIRMYAVDGGVEVYSLKMKGGYGTGLRHFVPWSQVRITEESMHPDVMSDEIEDAEASDDIEDPNEPESEPEPEGAPTVPPPPPSNGQVSS